MKGGRWARRGRRWEGPAGSAPSVSPQEWAWQPRPDLRSPAASEPGRICLGCVRPALGGFPSPCDHCREDGRARAPAGTGTGRRPALEHIPPQLGAGSQQRPDVWAGAAPGDAGVPRPRSGLSPRRQNRPRCKGTPPDRPARPELGDSGAVLEPDRPGRGGAASPLAGSARAAWPAFLSRARRPRRLAGWVRRASVCGTDRGASTGRRAPRAQQRAPSAPQPRAARELRTSRVWARGSWTPRVRTWPESGAPACKLAQGSRGQGQGTRTPGGD